MDVWVDADTRLPLRIQLFARAVKDPAIDVGFIRIAFGHVDRSLFDFTPPDDATVNEIDVFGGGGSMRGTPVDDVRVFGRGWKTVVAFRLSKRLANDAVGAFPLQANLGSVQTVRVHGKTWLLAGFVSAHRLEGFIPHLS